MTPRPTAIAMLLFMSYISGRTYSTNTESSLIT